MTPPARRQPEDHKPKKPPQQREAEGDTLANIVWRGHKLTIDTNPAHLTGKTLLAFEQDRIFTALAGLLGADGWAEVENYRLDELSGLFDQVNEALGFEPGESAPSPA